MNTSTSAASLSSNSEDDISPLRIKRRRSALFHLGVSSSPKESPASIPLRFYVQIRYCNNGAVLSTELTLVYGDALLREALPKGSTNPFSLYIDPGAFHEPFRPISQLLRVQDFDVTIASAVEKWNCFKFIVDFDGVSPTAVSTDDNSSVSALSHHSDRFYSLNEIPVIDLGGRKPSRSTPFPSRRATTECDKRPPSPKPVVHTESNRHPGPGQDVAALQSPARSGRPPKNKSPGMKNPAVRNGVTNRSPRSGTAKGVQTGTPGKDESPGGLVVRSEEAAAPLRAVRQSESPASSSVSSRPRLFAKAPAHLLLKRRESAGGRRTSTNGVAFSDPSEGKTVTGSDPDEGRPKKVSPLKAPLVSEQNPAPQSQSPVKAPSTPTKMGQIHLDLSPDLPTDSLSKGDALQTPNSVKLIVTPRVKRSINVSSLEQRSSSMTPDSPETASAIAPALGKSLSPGEPIQQSKTKVQSSKAKRPRLSSLISRTLRVMLDKDPVPGQIYNSVVAAAKDANAGDQIVVSAGFYRERTTIDLPSNVTLRAAHGLGLKDVVIGTRSVSFAVLGVRGSNVTVRGLTLQKNQSKSKHSYPAIIDTDPQVQNFQLIDCRIDGCYDKQSADKCSHFQGVFFDMESSGRIENCILENIPDHGVVSNPDGMVHITGGVIRNVEFSAVRIAKRLVKKLNKGGVCLFLNNVEIGDTGCTMLDSEPGQISLNGVVNTSA